MSTSPTIPQNGAHMHRRKSSREEDDNVLIFPLDVPAPPVIQAPPPPANGKLSQTQPQSNGSTAYSFPKPGKLADAEKSVQNGQNGWGERTRVTSNPTVPSAPRSAGIPISQSHPPHPPSAGPYRTSFAAPWPAHANGAFPYGRHQPPGIRQSLSLPVQSSHARARSVSGPFSPITPSPLASSFPVSQTTSRLPHQSSTSTSSDLSIKSSATAPEFYPSQSPPKARFPGSNGMPVPTNSSTTQQMRRHSRIHSRNLSVYFPHPGSISATSIDEDDGQEVTFPSSVPDDGVPMPSASPGPGQRSFREGFTFGARPMESPGIPVSPALSSGASRRGHHHKHSLSHNFFSFLEPGGVPEDLRTTPTLTPVSPWNPISPFPSEKDGFGQSSPSDEFSSNGHVHVHSEPRAAVEAVPIGRVRARPGIDAEAACVAAGQFVLGACLWVVGQQIGSLSCTGLGYWVVFDAFGVALGRVLPGYLAKPDTQGGMRRPYGIAFPPLLLSVTLLSLIATALKYKNQAKLVSATGNFIPPLPSLLPIRLSYSTSHYAYPPIIANLLSNPYTLTPTLTCAAILGGYLMLPPYQHRLFDLLLAGIETVVTFSLAYPAAVSLGAVLLQTAPPRGLPGGRMEAFLRAMREIERHPQVLHLPAPHIWQLTPYFASPPNARLSSKLDDGPSQSLVVTLELHVPKSLSDDDVLQLTQWASERCRTAIKYGSGDGGGDGEADITVGVVRG
ncbi:hypothetical protein EIP86_009401 [Pleurotus ostreatoroseus]|nr:hypothetical protein EIP86_009401 [Pleurotus ostreatoroseus]